MTATSQRVLDLLGLLQTGRVRSGAELADRLGVSRRTIRNDIGRLRACGYEIAGVPGGRGGYRLATTATTPPPMLGPAAATAVALALRTGPAPLPGGSEATEQALGALGRLLPGADGRALRDLGAAVAPTPECAAVAPAIDPARLIALAGCCRRGETVRMELRPPAAPAPTPAPVPGTRGGAGARASITSRARPLPAVTRVELEPYRLLRRGPRWFLLAFDPCRACWLTVPAGAAEPITGGGRRFVPRPLPGPVVSVPVEAPVRAVPAGPIRASLTAALPADAAQALLPGAQIRPDGAHRCRVRLCGPSLAHLTAALVGLDAEIVVHGPDRLRRHLDLVAARMSAAARPRPDATGRHIASPTTMTGGSS